ncbi:hypothetical protein PPTG_08656 [Phytophthora nicotianae INRA-310]|uniref:Uncharacterized protein n=1 Tax=Phytophthora nicotianae (strain INRA-310) TaxID=761204 RepID=W2QNC8_PHYN3|nr:hypothetical protein PPTG_08656 [Phytophthora nicotianae INRA-310]ETN13994.1 hypothetical protein PPTG_08656 [Phytophthora nicotianae INRA-310]
MSKRVNGGGSVMIWAGVSKYGNTEVVFWREDKMLLSTRKHCAETCYFTWTSSDKQRYNNGVAVKSPDFNITENDHDWIVVNSALYSVKKMLKYISNPLYIVFTAKKKFDIDNATFFMNENKMSCWRVGCYANGRQFESRVELKAWIKAEWAGIEPNYTKKLVRVCQSVCTWQWL